MKRVLSICSLFLFALGSMSYAASKESGSVSFPIPVRIGATNLPAGTYEIHWETGSSDAQVEISGNGHQVSVPATLTPAVGQDQVLIHRVGNAQVVDGFTVKTTSFTLKNP